MKFKPLFLDCSILQHAVHFSKLFSLYRFTILPKLIVICIIHREKIKKLHALEAERAAAITQWIKKVIVEKQCHEQDTVRTCYSICLVNGTWNFLF